MKKSHLLGAVACFWLFSAPVRAEWQELTRAEMICSARQIAIGTIENIKPAKGKFGIELIEYPETATFTVEKVLKGDIPRVITINGGKNSGSFMCYPGAGLRPGRCLIFLTHNGEHYFAMNASLGMRPIINGEVEWGKTDAASYKMQPVKLSDVESEIATQLKKCPDSGVWPASF